MTEPATDRRLVVGGALLAVGALVLVRVGPIHPPPCTSVPCTQQNQLAWSFFFGVVLIILGGILSASAPGRRHGARREIEGEVEVDGATPMVDVGLSERYRFETRSPPTRK